MILKRKTLTNKLLWLAAGVTAVAGFPSISHAQTNLLANPGFEDGCNPATAPNAGFEVPVGWEAFNGGTCSTDAARTGTVSAYLNNSGIGNFSAPALIQQGFVAAPGEIFYFSGWVKVQDEVDFAILKINFRDTVNGVNVQPLTEDPELLPGTEIINDPTFPGIQTDPLIGSTISNGGTLSDDWIFVEVRGTVPEGCDLIQFIVLHVPVGPGGFWVDDMFAYKLDGPSYVYPKQQITAVPNGADMDVTWQSTVPRDYRVESSTDLDPLTAVWTDESGVIGGTGGEIVFTVPGAAPGVGARKFFRLQSDPIDRGTSPNGIIDDNFTTETPTMTDWLGYAVFTATDTTVEEGPYNTTEAPFTVSGSNTATFGINDLKNDGAPQWDGATAEVSVYQSFPAPENTDGVRPYVNLRGRTMVFQGTAAISEAYASGNKGEVYIEFIDANNEVALYKALDISVDNPTTGDYDNSLMNTSTGQFRIYTYVPENNLNYINIGYRNTGVVDSAGEMNILSSPVPNTIVSLATGSPWLGETPPDSTNIVRNAGFTEGTDGLDEWELFQSWEAGTITPLADGNVSASGGVVTFGVDADDAGAASLQQNFYLPKNNEYANLTYNMHDRAVTFSGIALASGYAGGNFPQIGIQVLNLGNSINASTIWITDLSVFDDINCDGTTYDPITGAFTITTTIPGLGDGINAVQIVFRNNIVTPGGGGQLEISNLSFVVAPIVTLGTATTTGNLTPAAGVAESYSVSIDGTATDVDYVWDVFPDTATVTGGNASSVTISFPSSGSYTVTATVCDPTASDAPSVSDSLEITVP